LKVDISVIIPNYNHQKYLQKRLDSVFAQTSLICEVIILDDCSTDNSKLIIEEYLNKDPAIIFLQNLQNSGSTFKQWNKAISLAKGEFIWIAESDDFADPKFLETMMAPLMNNPEVVISYCQSYRMDGSDTITGTWKDFTDNLDPILFESDFEMEGFDYIEQFLIHRNTIPNASAVVFRKSIYNKIGGAVEHLKTNSDWLTWLKMLCHGRIAFVSDKLNYFRYHSSSVIAKASMNQDPSTYKEWFDFTMRKEFGHYLKRNQIQVTPTTIKINDLFIANELGNKGLFLLKRKNFLTGWFHIIQASIYPVFQTGFIKRAFSS